ncbi:M15 family metallopeptidase [Pseudoalteromonas shioyasakiensis]|uniref:M15 family metallopeptidase n=1 Tax=Pseudoalteromonas shioyasakiensis TaxID=1190813 RepID=UPI0021193218|nr:M15 family metallopeptidase [Pseudoalteromonas shioyasakiensis]MCQ8878868.1 M15 family metallopeptidase [Pseudoalteromonas shioyasakiensis]
MFNKLRFKSISLLCVIGLASPLVNAQQTEHTNKRNEFVDVATIMPTAIFDIRYYSANNFVGQPIDGYKAPKCLLHQTAAKGLQQAHKHAQQAGYNLKIFDCYRPQRAVDHFVRWVNDESDTKTKPEYYPNLGKDKLLGGYIAAKSGHSRGSTIDLTLTDATGKELNMGSLFDMFDTISNTDDERISDSEKANRYLLKNIMMAAGFAPYSMEWWHFTYKPQAYPDTYFDFVVQ